MANSITQYFYTSDTWVAPPGTTTVQAEAWGGGGNGATRTTSGQGGGGGGGGYGKANAVTVTPGSSYVVTVGAAAGDSWFSNTGSAPASSSQGALGKGGSSVASNVATAGAGGPSASCVGDTVASGGAGAAGATNGGGGGESGGPNGTGNAASAQTGGSGNADAGNGGNGATTSAPGSAAPLPGDTSPATFNVNAEGVGGGGGGAKRTAGSQTGGAGAPGLVRLTYTTTNTPYIIAISSAGMSAGTLTNTLSKPTGTIDGDILVLTTHNTNGAASAPVGFTSALQTSIGGGARIMETFIKVASSEGSSYTVTAGGSSYGQVQLVTVRSAATTSTVNASAGDGGTSTTANPGTITPTVANSLLFFNAGTISTTKTFSAFSIGTSSPTFIEQYDFGYGNAPSGAAMAWGIRAATTATTSGSATVSGSADWTSQILAFSPLPVGPANIKTFDGVTQNTGVKTYLGVAVASTKSWDGIT